MLRRFSCYDWEEQVISSVSFSRLSLRPRDLRLEDTLCRHCVSPFLPLMNLHWHVSQLTTPYRQAYLSQILTLEWFVFSDSLESSSPPLPALSINQTHLRPSSAAKDNYHEAFDSARRLSHARDRSIADISPNGTDPLLEASTWLTEKEKPSKIPKPRVYL